MFKKPARLLGLVASTALALMPLVVQPLAAGAATTGTLFALSQGTVYKADPSTGALTAFATLPVTPPTQPAPSFGGLASDPVGHRLFVQRMTASDFTFTTVSFQILTVNTKTAAVSVSPDMAQGLTDLAFDTSTGSLFAETNFCCPFQVVRVDPATGVQTHVADLPGVQDFPMAVAPARHALYLTVESFAPGQFQPINNVVTSDTTTGALTQGPQLAVGIFALVYDTSSGVLFGKTFCCPANLVKVDPAASAEPLVTTGLSLGAGITIDSASHTIYMTSDQFGATGQTQLIQTINDQTGASTFSTGSIPPTTYVSALAFEGVAITPESIKTDVQSALASGAITKHGIAHSLLAKLNHAEAARARGQCGVAANAYGAFINEVEAQSGKAIAPSTAAQLISEAQFLVANCP
jgi:hypothetical protein